MQLKTLFLVSVLMLFYSASEAQIGFGHKKIGGNAALNYNYLSENHFFNPTQLSNYSATLNPIIGTFTGKKTLFTIQPNAQYTVTPENRSQNYYGITNSSLGLNVSLRHYLNPDAKWKFYGEIMGGVFDKTIADNSGNSINNNTKNIGVLLGANKFLNNSLALNFQMGCNFLFFQERFYDNRSTGNYFLNLNLENFVNTDTKDTDSMLIAKGRKTIDGNLNFGYYVYEESTTLVGSLDVKYGQLITSRLMVGGALGLYNEAVAFGDRKIDIQVFTRYYIPMTKKLFFYPQIKVLYGRPEFIVSRFSSRFSRSSIYLEGSLGLNYFIKKNVALEVDLIRFSYTDNDYTNLRAGANVGLRYFLK